MKENKSLIVGIDFGTEMTQVSYLDEGNQRVEAVILEPGSVEQYGIADLIGIRGRDHVVALEQHFRGVLEVLRRQGLKERIAKVVITIRTLEVEFIEQIYEALERVGLLKDRVKIISYEQSYLYFALSQKKELWMNDVALFDFSAEGLMYYQLGINRKARPIVVGIQGKNFREIFPYFNGGTTENTMSHAFEQIVNTVLHKQIISTIYLTGTGFMGEWIQECLKLLCQGRRVFVGQNLYSFGACYAAKNDVMGDLFQEFVFLSEESLAVNVGMQLYTNSVLSDVIVIPTATAWYDVNRVFCVILDGENELQFTIEDVIKKTKQRKIVSLEGLELKGEKGSRLEVRLYCLDQKTLVITVKDLGFGELIPTSHRIWEQVILL